MEIWSAFCWAANEVSGNATRVMNCDEATLALAWTTLDSGVRDASIINSYLLSACCVYRLVPGVCLYVRLSLCRKMEGSYTRTLFTWVWAPQSTDSNEPGVYRSGHVNSFVASCIGLAAVSSLYMYNSECMSSGDSIHCSAVFCLGVGEAYDTNFVPPVYTLLVLLY